MRRIQFALASACLIAVAYPLHAQAAADTAAFRRGQWGVEFIPGTSVTEAGILRFSTPTRAWVVDGAASYNHQTSSSTVVADQSGQSAGFSARVGPRWYHGEYERVVRFVGVGVTGGYSRGSQSTPNFFRSEAWSAGIYGELGLQYLFTRHLGLGVRDMVLLSRMRITNVENGSTSRSTNDLIGLQSPQIIGSFYF